ncbi:MAG: glycoside hydrolase family 3 protein [Clostridia bacterium]
MKKIVTAILILTLGIVLMGCVANNAAPSSSEPINSDSSSSATPPESKVESEPDSKPESTPNNLSAEAIKKNAIDEKISKMSIEEKIGQLFFVAFREDANGNAVTAINDEISKTIKDYSVGGVILFGENIDTAKQTTKFVSDMQKESTIPLFIGTDEEGGTVSRLNASGKLDVKKEATAGSIGKTGDTKKAYNMMSRIAKELKPLGINLDFAPDADINTNPKNPVIGNRAFGTKPYPTADMVSSAIKGLTDNGILATAKHFPGHGDTTTDTHKGETIVKHDIERLRSEEFIPFKRAIKDDIPFIMVAHIKTPNITTDNLPATMSHKMITEILREELGFQKIVITDSLSMGAITEYYNSGNVATNCIKAGVDMLLMPKDLNMARKALLEAVTAGTISEDRINTSLRRILSVKYDAGLFK